MLKKPPCVKPENHEFLKTLGNVCVEKSTILNTGYPAETKPKFCTESVTNKTISTSVLKLSTSEAPTGIEKKLKDKLLKLTM